MVLLLVRQHLILLGRLHLAKQVHNVSRSVVCRLHCVLLKLFQLLLAHFSHYLVVALPRHNHSGIDVGALSLNLVCTHLCLAQELVKLVPDLRVERMLRVFRLENVVLVLLLSPPLERLVVLDIERVQSELLFFLFLFKPLLHEDLVSHIVLFGQLAQRVLFPLPAILRIRVLVLQGG